MSQAPARLPQLFERLSGYGRQPCLIGDTPACGYDALLRAVAAWRTELAGRGIGPATVVAVRADYSLQSVALLLALVDAAAVAVLVPRNQPPDYFLEASLAQWCCELDAADNASWRALAGSGAHALLSSLAERHEGGLVVFTSGSSGRPKAALQSIERFLHKFDRPGRRMRTLAFLLLDHIAGLDTLFYTLSNGGELVITRRRDPQSVLDLIARHRVEVLPASPSFLRLLTLDAHANERDLSSLKIITYGSEPMDATTLARLNVMFPGVQIAQKYGTTETGSPRSISRGNDSLWLKLSSRSLETRVVDGVLRLRGPGTFLGYLNAPSSVDPEGWYDTGDCVEVDGDWIRFRGRATDSINVGGEKVAPVEVEQVILELDFVNAAAVSGEAHVLMGQIVVARVTVTPETDAAEAERRIRQHCLQRLARYKVPVKLRVETSGLVTERQKTARRPEGLS
jgi:acyl-CoA synthetase (AMP-forming)/AMP-acid ligase II